jgi:hypothetical protein
MMRIRPKKLIRQRKMYHHFDWFAKMANRPLFFRQESSVVEPNREVEQAVASLTTEILKLSPHASEARDALNVTIENAFSRLAQAILAQASQAQEQSLEEPISVASA